MKLTLGLICLILAVSLARDVTFKGTTCTDTGGTNKLSNSKGEKIKVMTEKDHACAEVLATIAIEKGDLDFYVKVGRYDQDKLDNQVHFEVGVTGGNVVTALNEKNQIEIRGLLSQRGFNMKGLKADGTLIVTIPGRPGRKQLKKGIKIEVTVGRGKFTEIMPIVFWIFFVILAITCVILFAAAIVLAIIVIKKLKK